MFRSLLLGGTAPLVYFAPEGDGAAAELPLETPDTPAADAPAADAATDPPAAAAAEPPQAPRSDWRDKELNRKHAKLKTTEQERDAERARVAEVTAENERLRALIEAANRRAPNVGEADRQPPPPVEPRTIRTEPIRPAAQSDDERIAAKAAQIVAQQTAEQQMDAAVAKGKGDYGNKWDGAIENLRCLGGFDQDTLMGILATDDPAKVLFELGHDPGEGKEPAYIRVMQLPPAKRLNELAKIALKTSNAPPAKKISDAAPPVEPIVQGGTAAREKPFDIYDQQITPGSWEKSPFEVMKMDSEANDEKWFAARAEQKKNSKGRPWSRQ